MLLGEKVICVTDHKALLRLADPEATLSPKNSRWLAEILEFDITIRHIEGDSGMMALSDYLSRKPQLEDQLKKSQDRTLLMEARAAVASSPVPGVTRDIKLPRQASVLSLSVARGEPLPKTPLPSDFPPILSFIASAALLKRASSAVKHTLLRRHEMGSWRWNPNLPNQASLEARKLWLTLGEEEAHSKLETAKVR